MSIGSHGGARALFTNFSTHLIVQGLVNVLCMIITIIVITIGECVGCIVGTGELYRVFIYR